MKGHVEGRLRQWTTLRVLKMQRVSEPQFQDF
jgi:hypothetical protein